MQQYSFENIFALCLWIKTSACHYVFWIKHDHLALNGLQRNVFCFSSVSKDWLWDAHSKLDSQCKEFMKYRQKKIVLWLRLLCGWLKMGNEGDFHGVRMNLKDLSASYLGGHSGCISKWHHILSLCIPRNWNSYFSVHITVHPFFIHSAQPFATDNGPNKLLDAVKL